MPTTKEWTDTAKEQLEGRKIVEVRYLTKEEAEDLGWDQRSVVLILDSGLQAFCSADDEGNGAGALFTTDPRNDILPVLSLDFK